MECLKCGAEIGNARKCPECGTNADLMKKVYNISAKLYNQGLEKTKNADFFFATEVLKKSIEFNKQNIQARNLLGLIYYNTGRLADAVKEWIISTNINSENNPAVDYINNFQDNIREFEKLNDAVKMYNDAIKYIKQKNDDLAIIRLKKALDINPNFIDALNLLTLCYIGQNKKDLATECAEKVLEIDINNPIALKYLRNVNSIKRIKSIKKKKNFNQQNENKSLEPKDTFIETKKGDGIGKIISFIVGAVCAVVVMYVLVIPAMENYDREAYQKLKSEYDTIQQSYKKNQTESQNQIKALQDENAQLKNQTAQSSSNKATLEGVNNAKQILEGGNYVEAAKLIAGMDITGVDATIVNVYNQVKSGSYQQAAQQCFDNATKYLNTQDLENAKTLFTQCITFSENNDDLKYSAYYQLAKIALGNGDNETAKKYFNEVKAHHPNSTMQGYADNYLKTL